ncbi:MAG TPA: histidinol-phosphate transaminase [Herpetosiphonaceae bacterium]
MRSFDDLVRPDIAALEPYTPIIPFDVLSEQLGLPIDSIIKLDANENPHGPAPGVAEALARFPFYAIYPDPDQTRLRRAISPFIGQPVERIICGNGSDEIIDLLMRILVQPGDAVVACPPTFGMYSFNTGVVAGRYVAVPRDENFDIDIEAIAEAVVRERAKLVFLPSPNNPTGNVVPREQVRRLAELDTIIVLDEAYAEFSGESASDLVGEIPNLVVLRTFSKWAGLAGLRLGYGLVPEWLITHLWKIKPPYNTNVAAEEAVIRSLEQADLLHERARGMIAERDRLYAELRTIEGLHPFPSSANFILCRVERGDAWQIKQELASQGILVRYYRTPQLANFIRISIGLPQHHDTLLRALRALFSA